MKENVINNEIIEDLEKIKIIQKNKSKIQYTETTEELYKLFFGCILFLYAFCLFILGICCGISKSFNIYTGQHVFLSFFSPLVFSLLSSSIFLYFVLKIEKKKHLFNMELIKKVSESVDIDLDKFLKKDSNKIKDLLYSYSQSIVMKIARQQKTVYFLLKALKDRSENLQPYKKIIFKISEESLKIKNEETEENEYIDLRLKTFQEKFKGTEKTIVFEN